MTRLFHRFTARKMAPGFRPRRGRLAALLGAVIVLAAGSGLASATPAAAAGTSYWTSYLFNSNHSSYNSGATAITASNLANLQPIATFMPGTQFLASPIEANGMIYIGGENGNFYAVKESSRSVAWTLNTGLTLNGECGEMGQISTAAVANNATTGATVYVNGTNGQLYALNATTGAIIWQATVDTPSTTVDDYYAWASPVVANGYVYIGVSSNCDNPPVLGQVLAFNAATGAQVASWNTQPAGQNGASVWTTPAVSTLGDGSIFVTTANAANNSQPANAESIVRLNGSSLSLMDAWQVPAAQRVPDSDFGGSPTDFTASINGTSTPMVGACNKNGIYYAFKQNNLAAGPVWQDQIANGYGTGPNVHGQCDAAAIWDGTNLIEGGGNDTIINGTDYQGSVQSLNPATGAPVWQTGLPGAVIGSPTEDGAGIVAASTFESSTGNYGVYLLSASTGAILDYINTNPSQVWAQPVFSSNLLLIASEGLTAYQITTPGPAITAVSPNTLGAGGTETVTLTGSGLGGSPTVLVSGTLVSASSVSVKSPTTLQVNLTATAKAAPGPRNITVTNGTIAETCTNCLTIDAGPVISGVSPNSFAPGTTTPVTVTGTGFATGLTAATSIPGATVDTPANVTPTSFTVNVTVPPSNAAGNYQLTVVNPDDGAGAAAITVT